MRRHSRATVVTRLPVVCPKAVRPQAWPRAQLELDLWALCVGLAWGQLNWCNRPSS